MINKAVEANSNHTKSKQDRDDKRAMMEDSYSKALTYRIWAGEAGAGSKKQSRHTANASKRVEMALLATPLEAEDEMPLITALQEEIDELPEGRRVAPLLMGTTGCWWKLSAKAPHRRVPSPETPAPRDGYRETQCLRDRPC